MYTHYVGNFDKATETLSLWTKKSPVMAALIDEIQVSLKIHFVLIIMMIIISFYSAISQWSNGT